MGGEGSGRKPDMVKRLVGLNQPVPTDGGVVFLPNLSGVKEEALKTSTTPIGGGVWGSITGTLSNQTDLQNALDAKLNLSGGTMSGDINMGFNTLTHVDEIRMDYDFGGGGGGVQEAFQLKPVKDANNHIGLTFGDLFTAEFDNVFFTQRNDGSFSQNGDILMRDGSANWYAYPISSVTGAYLPLAGGTMAGNINGTTNSITISALNIDVDNILGNSGISKIDMDNGTLLNDVSGYKISLDFKNRRLYKTDGTTVAFSWENAYLDAHSNLISNVTDPVSAQDAATKNWVTNNFLGGAPTITLSGDVTGSGTSAITTTLVYPYKRAVRVATTAALTVTYNNGSSGVGATLTNAGAQSAISIDGVTLSTNDRVLVNAQASGFQNGVYKVTNVGSGSTNWVLTRTTDYDNSTNGLISYGDIIPVLAGATNAAILFLQTQSAAITMGTTAITFTGNAASSGGSVASVSNSDSTLTISPNTGAVVASLNLNHANTWTATQTLKPTSTSTVGTIVKLLASQTADAFEVQDSTAAVLAKIDSAGTGTFSGSGQSTITKGLVVNNGSGNASADMFAVKSSTGYVIQQDTGDKLGFFNVTPVTRPSAYTQTYSTASKTHPNATSSNLSTTAATQITPYGFTTQAQADNIATQVNAMQSDIIDLKKLVNSLIDDLQALGLAQ